MIYCFVLLYYILVFSSYISLVGNTEIRPPWDIETFVSSPRGSLTQIPVSTTSMGVCYREVQASARLCLGHTFLGTGRLILQLKTPPILFGGVLFL